MARHCGGMPDQLAAHLVAGADQRCQQREDVELGQADLVWDQRHDARGQSSPKSSPKCVYILYDVSIVWLQLATNEHAQ